MPPSRTGLGWSWKSWLNYSCFAFPNPDLEAMFRVYASKGVSPWTLWCTGVMIMGLVLFASKFAGAADPDGCPRELWGLCLCHLILSGTHLYVMLFRPSFNLEHQHLIKPVVMLYFMFTSPFGRETLFWMKLASSKGVDTTQSLLHELQMLAVENVLTSTMWFVALAFSSGQVPDLVILTWGLANFLGSNRSICESPKWGPTLVSMRPGYLVGAQATSVWIRAIGVPYIIEVASNDAMTCTEVLGLWSLMGWWIACGAVFTADILRRRAFLRTNEALASYGQAYVVSAWHWPFGNPAQLQRCLMAFLVLTYSTSLMWTSAFPYLH